MRYRMSRGNRRRRLKRGLRGRTKKMSDCSSNSMRGRFGSPIFGPEHFQTRSLWSLQTQPPPRIELSVQISILTANLPANSPLFHVLLLTRLAFPSATSVSVSILLSVACVPLPLQVRTLAPHSSLAIRPNYFGNNLSSRVTSSHFLVFRFPFLSNVLSFKFIFIILVFRYSSNFL